MWSMTGFGRGQHDDDTTSITCEVRTVNHKGLDVKTRLPRELSHLELTVLQKLRTVLERGRIDVAFNVQRRGATSPTLLDITRAARVLDELASFARTRTDLDAHVTTGDLLHLSALWNRSDDDNTPVHDASALLALDAALADLASSRAREGQGLHITLQGHLDTCARLVDVVRARAALQPAELATRLRQRFEHARLDIDAERFAQEAALLADRVDVNEELARLDLHLTHARELMASSARVGRKLDFLCQELLREANTTGSKCSDASIAHRIVELKSEIERLREQVQNVE